MKNLLIIVMVSISLVGCATPNTVSPQGTTAEVQQEQRKQRELALKRMLGEDKRVKDIAYPILKANASLCKSTAQNLGIFFWNEHIVPKEYKEAANIHFGVGEVLQVQEIYKGSPASKAELKTGDKLIAINDVQIPSGKNAVNKAVELMDSVKEPEVKITVNRDGQEFAKTIKRETICDYGIVFNPDDTSINAFADGKNIHIPRGMLRFIDSDTELALILSHELAHNAMGHIDKKKQNALAAGAGGFLVDILFAAAGVNTQGSFTDMAAKAGAGSYSVEFEQEADYVGMYFMERAGYKTNGVANFWRRMTSELDDASIDHGGTHPTNPERFVAIEKTYTEIQDKKKKGKDLTPEFELKDSAKERVQVKTGYNE